VRDAAMVLDEPDIGRAVRRMSHEIVEHHRGTQGLLVLGIPTRGVFLARRIAAAIAMIEGQAPPLGSLDITMYRDDLRLRPARSLEPTSIPDCGVDERHVVLVDDVLYSGRTVRAALDAIADLGRPAAVQLAVLVDRGHRELPIAPDYLGETIATERGDHVRVCFRETDGRDGVFLTAQEARK